MRKTVIFSEFILLFLNILVIAQKFRIEKEEVQVWEVFQGTNDIMKLNMFESHIPFDANRMFILLKILHPRWSIFYWLGKETTIEQRKNTAVLAGELWYQIINHLYKELIENLNNTCHYVHAWYQFDSTTKSFILELLTNYSERVSSALLVPDTFSKRTRIIPTIHRETEDNESELFKIYFEKYVTNFQLARRVKISDLYEIKWNNDMVSIDLIPLHSQKNENENLYVLDKGNEIIYSKIYHSRLVSSKITLIYDLINEQLPNRTIIKPIGIEDTIDNYIGAPELVNQEPVPDTKNKILFKLQSSGESTHMVNVPLSVNEISEYTCYVLWNETTRYLYIYIGKYSNLYLIYTVLIFVENMSTKQRLEKIIFAADTNLFVLDKNRKHPTAFWVNFDNNFTHYWTFAKNELSTYVFSLLKNFVD